MIPSKEIIDLNGVYKYWNINLINSICASNELINACFEKIKDFARIENVGIIKKLERIEDAPFYEENRFKKLETDEPIYYFLPSKNF